ncbi:hypothetical protein Glove_242g129 [Diversispora epigaea]|uniref:Uncharacterized protein n=1 Tax=Diversispora epigaea TaxID=1348612 RepID=A0A397IA43_9GLOM|nr:hypothetical protein Glove_242g129 [Diversispora epigaea]
MSESFKSKPPIIDMIISIIHFRDSEILNALQDDSKKMSRKENILQSRAEDSEIGNLTKDL